MPRKRRVLIKLTPEMRGFSMAIWDSGDCVAPKDCPECGTEMPGIVDVGIGEWWRCPKCGYKETHPDCPVGTEVVHGSLWRP